MEDEDFTNMPEVILSPTARTQDQGRWHREAAILAGGSDPEIPFVGDWTSECLLPQTGKNQLAIYYRLLPRPSSRRLGRVSDRQTHLPRGCSFCRDSLATEPGIRSHPYRSP